MKANQLVTTRLSVVPIRLKPDETSEQVTQLLFGEQAGILEMRKDSWAKVQLVQDGYIGWLDSKMVITSPIKSNGSTDFICLDLFGQAFSDEHSTWITLGAHLPAYDGMMSTMGDDKFRYSGQAVRQSDLEPSVERIERLSKKLLNTPYLWGGRTPLGIDCSGYTQLIYKCCGITIDRDAKDQALQGTMVDFVSESQVGDLAFFCKKSEKITHVGIILPNQRVIHASGKVRIDKIDHYGIFNEEMQEYTHRLKIIRRFI